MLRKAIILLFFLPLCLLAAAQGKITVSGTVLDDNGDPLPGLTVLVENSTDGAVTDANGRYSIKVSSSAVLLYDCMGYKQVKELVRGRNVIDVKMEPDNNYLDEVVVVGYGTMKRTDLTGSVASVSSKNIENFRTGSVVGALGGQIAGVQLSAEFCN